MVRSTETEDLSKNKVEKLKSFLVKNKSFNFIICPIATTNEITENENDPMSIEEALDLAEKRIMMVKSKIGSIENTVYCKPTVSEETINKGLLKITL